MQLSLKKHGSQSYFETKTEEEERGKRKEEEKGEEEEEEEERYLRHVHLQDTLLEVA